MNIYNINELSTTSESDSEYLVDSRYCRTTVKCKRKAIKKTIKLIHGRCVVVYRGSGDLLPIAAKDADRNCYCDFVFICHDPKPVKLLKEKPPMPRSRSALHDSSISDDDDDDIDNNENIYQKRFVPSNNNQQLTKQNSFSFKTKLTDINNHNNNENTRSSTINQRESLNKQLIVEDTDSDIDESSPSIIYFPSTHTKPISNIVIDTNT